MRTKPGQNADKWRTNGTAGHLTTGERGHFRCCRLFAVAMSVSFPSTQRVSGRGHLLQL
jgi:hypothetical protein